MIQVGDSRLHMYETGTGSPAVVLEAGIAGSSLGWAIVQPEIASFTRVCSYDRAGLGWSEISATPRTLEGMVSELGGLLSAAGIPPPYILVGHSFGGLVIRAFAHLRPQEVAGLVFVDPVSLESWASCEENEARRLRLGIALSRRGALLARLGIVRFALAVLWTGHTRLPKLIAKAAAGKGIRTLDNLVGQVRKLPPEIWPVIRAHWSTPKCFKAMADYLECLPASAKSASEMQIPEHVPFIVLSAANATAGELTERERWVKQSNRGRHIQLGEAGHWIQLEEPEAVVNAIRELAELLCDISP